MVRELDMPIKVIGMDGCKVNTGPHSGGIMMLELLLNDPPHVVRSVTKSNEFPQKRDQWKMYRTYMYSLKSFRLGF